MDIVGSPLVVLMITNRNLGRSTQANVQDGCESVGGVDIRGGDFGPSVKALLVVLLLQASLMLPLTETGVETSPQLEQEVIGPHHESPPWYDYPEFPVWEQFGQNPNRLPITASHGPDGGSVGGDPGAAQKLDSITDQ